jgi:hypothetical protein
MCTRCFGETLYDSNIVSESLLASNLNIHTESIHSLFFMRQPPTQCPHSAHALHQFRDSQHVATHCLSRRAFA